MAMCVRLQAMWAACNDQGPAVSQSKTFKLSAAPLNRPSCVVAWTAYYHSDALDHISVPAVTAHPA